jgi:hypothetical protein
MTRTHTHARQLRGKLRSRAYKRCAEVGSPFFIDINLMLTQDYTLPPEQRQVSLVGGGGGWDCNVTHSSTDNLSSLLFEHKEKY